MHKASAVIRQHVRRCGTKGNRSPRKSSSRKNSDAATRVGGAAGAGFSNDIGRR